MVYKCKHCEKEYKSSSSRSNHIRIYHYEIPNLKPIPITECKYCLKDFNNSSYKIKHEKICPIKIEQDKKIKEQELNNQIIDMKKEQEEIKKKQEDLEKQNQELKNIIQKTNQEINIQGNNTNIAGNQNNTTNNTIINIVPLGTENLNELLTDKEKLRILNNRCNGLKELIELVHISDKPKYNQ